MPLANILSTFCEFCKIVTFGKFKDRKLHFLYYNYLKNMTIYVFIVCNINVWMVHRVSEANLFFNAEELKVIYSFVNEAHGNYCLKR